MKLIIGLGNPGKKYEKTRHNLGLMVVDEFISKLRSQNSKLPFKSQNYPLAKVFLLNQVILAKPQTYMNASGKAVKFLIANYSITQLLNLWVVHDDLDLPLGKIRIKKGGGSAGHRGLESIVKELGTTDFVRFRLGIGHPNKDSKFQIPKEQLVERYVLSEFKAGEKSTIKKMIKKAVSAIEVALGQGLEAAMNQFN